MFSFNNWKVRQKNVDRQGASSGGKACVILVKRRRGVDNGLSIGTGLRLVISLFQQILDVVAAVRVVVTVAMVHTVLVGV